MEKEYAKHLKELLKDGRTKEDKDKIILSCIYNTDMMAELGDLPDWDEDQVSGFSEYVQSQYNIKITKK